MYLIHLCKLALILVYVSRADGPNQILGYNVSQEKYVAMETAENEAVADPAGTVYSFSKVSLILEEC